LWHQLRGARADRQQRLSLWPSCTRKATSGDQLQPGTSARSWRCAVCASGIEDLDHGAHLTPVFAAGPLALDNPRLGTEEAAGIVILDTAPEANEDRAREYLARSDWVLVPVKGPEENGVEALPMRMGSID
jgi:hypothetical protein